MHIRTKMITAAAVATALAAGSTAAAVASTSGAKPSASATAVSATGKSPAETGTKPAPPSSGTKPAPPSSSGTKPAPGPSGPKKARSRAPQQQSQAALTAALAAQLHVTVAQVATALGPIFAAGYADPDSPEFAAAARALGVTTQRLADALDNAKRSLGGKLTGR